MKARVFKIVLFAMIFIFSAKAFSLSIAMDVGEELNADLKTINSSTENGLHWLSVEFYNSGSIGYKATARLDVFSGSDRIFTYWTDSKEMVPGKKEYFELYGYAPSTGNYSTRLRIYFANEILEKWYPGRIWEVSTREEAFSAKIPHVSRESEKDFLEFELSSEKEIGKAIILPSKYPRGWIFPGIETFISANQTYRQKIFFEPDISSTQNVSILIVSSDGKYSNEYSLSLVNEESFLSGIISFLSSLFRS